MNTARDEGQIGRGGWQYSPVNLWGSKAKQAFTRVDGAAALQRAHTQLSGVQSPVWWPSTTGIRAAGRSAGPVRTPPPSTAPTMPSTRREGIEVCAICLEGLTLPDTSRKNRNALDPANSSDYRLASAYCENRCMLRQNLSAATRAPLAELQTSPPPFLHRPATILKAGAAGIECSLKAKHVLVPVMVGAAAVQRFSMSSVLSSSRS